MFTPRTPVAEITKTAIALLRREIGAVNTARFLNQFTTGFGNYTEERNEIIDDPTVDELGAKIRRRREKGNRKARAGPQSISPQRALNRHKIPPNETGVRLWPTIRHGSQ